MLSILVRNVKKSVSRRFFTSTNLDVKYLDPIQKSSLEEKCFLVNTLDKVIGTASKEECHRVKDNDIPLHRAFSVFLFNNNGDLLLQRRSTAKITYPNHFTNSCCSHPIADVPGEEHERDAIGVKRAAQRRLNYELGINVNEIPIEKFEYITRIMYKDLGNGVWGEHEIDYVLFIKSNVKLLPNPNEVSAISFIPRDELDDYIHTIGDLTPWFRIILRHRLRLWWDHLLEDSLDEVKDHEKILSFQDQS